MLEALEAVAEPGADEVALLTDDAFVWVGLGLAQRARRLVERWRRAGVRHPGLRRAEAVYTVAIAPPAAAGRLRELAGDPVASAVAVANHVFRGELRAAIARCRAEGWFLRAPAAINGVAYGVWALAMLDDFDEALAVIATWRHRHPRPGPEVEHVLLGAEARVESVRHHHGRARALLEEALAICDEHELGLPRAYLEANLAIALARSGERRAAARLARRWPAPRARPRPADEQALAIYREVARTELALLEGRYRDAGAAAARVLACAEAAGNTIYACLARGYRALAAAPGPLRGLVEDYGRAAAQLQIPVHVRRHRLLARLAASGLAPRARHLFVRSRDGRAMEPVLRTLFPTLAEVNADLCWDRVQGALYLGGEGPFSLGEHPILLRVLEAILGAPRFELSLAALFEAVWGMPYRPLVHEGKCHVALHRLRALLGGWRAGAERLIAVRDGTVRVPDGSAAVVLELAPGRVAEPGPAERLADRVIAALEASRELGIAELEARLGASRTGLQGALRVLAAVGRVARAGRARATRYRLTAPAGTGAAPR